MQEGLTVVVVVGQSAFTIHSGLQFGGDPIIPDTHEHLHWPPNTLGGLLFGPQGLGSHGSSATTGSIAIGFLLHAVNGSPMYPCMHVHDGMCESTLHTALVPHVPGQVVVMIGSVVLYVATVVVGIVVVVVRPVLVMAVPFNNESYWSVILDSNTGPKSY